MRAIISGGGTGGHIFPAIAIADAIKEQIPDAEILFVGAQGKMEMEKVPKAGYKIIGLKVAGFQRRMTWKNLTFPFKLMGSLMHARKILKEFKPDVAVGVGGYASGPTLRMANSAGIPSVLQEQNSYAGVTNKILAGKAEKICVAYDHMNKFFPEEKIIFTGNPVRQQVYDNDIDTLEAKTTLGLDKSKKTILITGGSLGARSLNEAIERHFEKLSQDEEYNVIWQVGKLYYDEYKNSKISKTPNVTVLPFIERMDMAYKAADIVVCRAGALTISELSLVVKAAILVPSPNVAEDHQTKNAMALVERDAAVLVKDQDAKETLVDEIIKLISDEEKIERLKSNIKHFGRPDAAKHIAEVVTEIAQKK